MDRLHTIWGEGFLAPGGPEEVREIVGDLDLAGRSVLDIGCGTGGPAIVLARELGAGGVVAIDVEPQVLARAARHAETAGVAGAIEFKLVEPGPLPFADASFDVVFSKDALVHIPDKAAVYREVLRVLRPGGAFAASDWLGGDNTRTAPEWALVQEIGTLDLTMVTAPETAAVMSAAGFETVSTRDRNAWYAELLRHENVQIEGPLRERLIEVAGEETYRHWVRIRRALRDAAVAGALRPTHLRGHKPAA